MSRAIGASIQPPALSPSAARGAYPSLQSGIWIPPGWGSNIKAKIDAGQHAVCAIWGDSLTHGMYSSSLRTKGWSSLLKTAWQASKGDGGSGFFGTMNSVPVLTAIGTASQAITAYTAATGDLWALTGTWSAQQTTGVGGQNIRSTTSGDTATAQFVRGRFIDIWTRSNVSHSYTYSIDGAAAVTVNAGAAVTKTTVDTGSSASTNHTVVITNTTTTASVFDLGGVTGRNSSGVRVDRYATQAAKTTLMDNVTAINTPGAWSGGALNPADMLIYGLMINDCGAGTAADTVATNIKKGLDGVYDQVYGGTTLGAVDLMFFIPHIGRFDNATPVYHNVSARIYALALHYNAAVVDLYTLGKRSWPWMAAQGYIGDGTNPGASGVIGSDTVHLSDLGHAWQEAQVLTALQRAGLA